MKRTMVVVCLLVSMFALSAPVHAADRKLVTGGLLLLGGAGTMALAFDYHSGCPAGYSTHTFQNLPTQCVYIGNNYSDVIDEPTSAHLARTGMLWAGVGAASLGVLVLAMPRRARRVAPSVTFTPTGWQASKAFRF